MNEWGDGRVNEGATESGMVAVCENATCSYGRFWPDLTQDWQLFVLRDPLDGAD